MTMHFRCAECNRLSLMLEQTVTEHEASIQRYQVAKLLGDRTSVASIAPMVRLASEDRDRAHRAMLMHVGLKNGGDRAAQRGARW
jgi:hypothetical protein